MFIEVSRTWKDGEAELVNVQHIIRVLRKDKKDANGRPQSGCIIQTTEDTLDVDESYEWILSYLPKAKQTTKYGESITIGEADRLKKERYANGR